MNTIKSSLLFLLIVMCLYSCSRKGDCPQLETQYFYTRFSVEDTSFIPYHGKDTLWFQASNGNTMKLVCYEKFPYSETKCIDFGTNPDCPGPKECYLEDKYFINFRTVDKKYELKLLIYKSRNFSDDLPTFIFHLNGFEIFGMNGLGIKQEFEKDSILFNGKYIIGSLQTWDSIGLYDIDYGLLRFKDENSIVWTLTDKR